MLLEINSKHIDSARVEQILKFYLGRLENQIMKLSIDLNDREQNQETQFMVRLQTTLNNGSTIEFMEIQKDLLIATQRVLDRLVRHLQLQRKRQRFMRQL